MTDASSSRRWRKEAAPCAVGALAAPVSAVGRWLGFPERNDLAVDHVVPGAAHLDVFGRHHETITEPATPFAGDIAKAAGGNPTIMSECRRSAHQSGKQGGR